MFEWHNLPEERKRKILNDVGIETGYSTTVIEKDWWVTVALKAVFSTPWAEHLVFKGGTSLSKAWNLIERFSEDVDLAMDRSVLGFNSEELSGSQIRKLREKSAAFMENEFIKGLQESIIGLGINPDSFRLDIQPIPNKDIEPRILILNYTSIAIPHEYIRDQVLIEIGARSLREPCSPRPITSFISNAFPAQPFADGPFRVETVQPQRTFLEKVFLLHEEFLKEPERRRHERLSRHLYDLFRLMDTEYGHEAISDKELFETIRVHRERYNSIRGISYDKHTYGDIDFIPPIAVRPQWKEDYEQMIATMIYGDSPTFGQLLEKMHELQERFKGMVSKIEK